MRNDSITGTTTSAPMHFENVTSAFAGVKTVTSCADARNMKGHSSEVRLQSVWYLTFLSSPRWNDGHDLGHRSLPYGRERDRNAIQNCLRYSPSLFRSKCEGVLFGGRLSWPIMMISHITAVAVTVNLLLSGSIERNLGMNAVSRGEG